MTVLVAACVTAFMISFIILPVIIKYFLKNNIVDVPNQRKVHRKVTPSMGGVSIFIGFLSATLIWSDITQWQAIKFVLAGLFIVFLIGLRDDLVPFQPLHKLYGQIFAVVVLLFSSVQINSLFGIFGVYEIPSLLTYTLTAFTIIVVTNSFNLIDGLDGLAGSIGIVSLIAFGSWFFLTGDFVFALFCFAMIGGVLAFLVYNWEPSEIFMGDTGAMVIGMLLAILAIHFMSANQALPPDSTFKFKATIASAACFIIIPLCDTLRIVILRVSKGQSPFRPDKGHVHHAIMRLGLTHSRTSVLLASVNGMFILGAFVLRNIGEKYMIPGVIGLCVMLSIVLDRLIIYKLSKKSSS